MHALRLKDSSAAAAVAAAAAAATAASVAFGSFSLDHAFLRSR